ncbi:hypothetical protein AB0N97_16125 [Streptomyces collinus]|uniref:hypothetical protein n=1 Tax=Streptomyces collinus TaxID=42684 RepID=UPI00344113FD
MNKAPVDFELAVGQAVEEAQVEDNAILGLGQLPVPVHQLGVLLVENAAVAVGPQGADVVPGGGFEAMVERGDSGRAPARVQGG